MTNQLPLDFNTFPAVTHIELNYSDVDYFINTYCEVDPKNEYSFCADMEAKNDTEYTIDCTESSFHLYLKDEKWLNGDLKEIQESIEDNGYPSAYQLFNILAFYGYIPKAKYLVNVSW